MNRAWSNRIAAVVYALWLAVVLVQPTALRTCAEHDGMPATRHGSSAAHARGAKSHEAPAKHHHACSCVGACCFAVAAALPIAAELLTAAETRQPARVIASYASDFRPGAPEHARPPTIGPPVSQA